MLKSAAITVMIVFSWGNLFSQTVPVDSVPVFLKSIQGSMPDTNQVKLFVRLSFYLLNKRIVTQKDRDSSLIFINRALKLSNLLKSPRWYNEGLKLKGNYYLRNGNFKNGQLCFQKAANYYRQIGNHNQEALIWMRFAFSIPDSSFSGKEERIKCFQQARIVYRKMGDKPHEIEAYWWIADVHMNEVKLDLAEKELLEVKAQYIAAKYLDRQHYTYFLLGAIHRIRGNLRQEIFYNLEAIKSMVATGDLRDAGMFYTKLGETYEELGMYEKSFYYFNESLKNHIQRNDFSQAYYTLQIILKVLIAEGRVAEALRFTQETVKKTPPDNMFSGCMMNKGFGIVYQALGANEKAESYFLKMIKQSDILYKNADLNIENYVRNYKITGEFYLSDKKYKTADIYFARLLSLPSDLISPVILSQIKLDKFRTDSASGNFLSAIRFFEQHKQLDDSIFNATKNKQIQELSFKYESDQKDENIVSLKKQAQLQQIRDEQSRTIRNLGVGMLILVTLLLIVVYNRFRNKQRNNVILEKQQREITAKNHSLESLLQDNEWLIREVHHRVKNNLQIVISLLNSQAAFLKDEVALNAVKESQHRMQAMSLIHQKLYKSDKTSTAIYMPEYIGDLVEYLKDSFMTKQLIYFQLDIQKMELDVSRAVPIGLILNEIITNAIKYAFPHSRDDKLKIILHKNEQQQISLVVSDNGKGLPDDYNIESNGSFGMILIKGLTEDMNGTFTLINKKGTTIVLTFEDDPIKESISRAEHNEKYV